MVKRPDWLAVGAAVLSIVTTLGAWAWWGGKFSQRMDTIEGTVKRVEERQSESERNDAKRDTAIAVTGQQYADIIRRLDGLDRKLDKR